MYEAIFRAAPQDAAGATAWLQQWNPILQVVLGDFDRPQGLDVTYGYMFANMVTAYETVGLPLDIRDAAAALGQVGRTGCSCRHRREHRIAVRCFLAALRRQAPTESCSWAAHPVRGSMSRIEQGYTSASATECPLFLSPGASIAIATRIGRRGDCGCAERIRGENIAVLTNLCERGLASLENGLSKPSLGGDARRKPALYVGI